MYLQRLILWYFHLLFCLKQSTNWQILNQMETFIVSKCVLFVFVVMLSITHGADGRVEVKDGDRVIISDHASSDLNGLKGRVEGWWSDSWWVRIEGRSDGEEIQIPDHNLIVDEIGNKGSRVRIGDRVLITGHSKTHFNGKRGTVTSHLKKAFGHWVDDIWWVKIDRIRWEEHREMIPTDNLEVLRPSESGDQVVGGGEPRWDKTMSRFTAFSIDCSVLPNATGKGES